MEKVRVGISGPGHNHAFAVGNCEEGELAAVCDLSDERRDAYVADYKKWMGAEAPDVPKVKLIDDLLADPEIEAVVIALSNSLHYPARTQNAKRLHLATIGRTRSQWLLVRQGSTLYLNLGPADCMYTAAMNFF
jgi:hypothetical protein